MIWDRIGKTVSMEGTTIEYYAVGHPEFRIQSRKRHIPHAGGKSGTWDYTSYFVLKDGAVMVEKNSLKDAKAFAEKVISDGAVN